MDSLLLEICSARHEAYAQQLSELYSESAKVRGIGIARRSAAYLAGKMQLGNALIALTPAGELAGFCYIESWGHGQYVSHSGLIVVDRFRQGGLARKLKKAVLQLSLQKFPQARIFGITTSGVVMKINTELGYRPVPFAELTMDKEFWTGCSSCPNYDILQRTEHKYCLCTAMIREPEAESPVEWSEPAVLETHTHTTAQAAELTLN